MQLRKLKIERSQRFEKVSNLNGLTDVVAHEGQFIALDYLYLLCAS